MTLCTVRSSVLQASLWKTITTLVLGMSSGYTFVLQLMKQNKEKFDQEKAKRRRLSDVE